MATTERFTISSDQLIERVKKLIHEGNIRKVKVIFKGETMIEMPLSVGAPAAAFTIMMAPFLAALGAVAALVAEVTIEVEKVDKSETEAKKEPEANKNANMSSGI